MIGGGIAGVSAAAHLAARGEVLLLEREGSLAYHTTGRSAAVFLPNYGSVGSRQLSAASRQFLEAPPTHSTDAPLLSERGVLWIARHGLRAELLRIAQQDPADKPGSTLLAPADVIQRVPFMRREGLEGGLYQAHVADLDVAALHQAFVRIVRANGGRIRTKSTVVGLTAGPRAWQVQLPEEQLQAKVIVNAAGAWGDEIARLAGVEPIGLSPMRRTAFMVPGSNEYVQFPMVIDAGNGYYFKPDGAQLLCSLSEENHCHPCDPKPRIEDVALAIERINEATTLAIRSVNSQWTGLRTFAPDGEIVLGEEPHAKGFFWLVGQGGTGIQTSPACGSLLASQVVGESTPADLAAAGINPDLLAPARFR